MRQVQARVASTRFFGEGLLGCFFGQEPFLNLHVRQRPPAPPAAVGTGRAGDLRFAKFFPRMRGYFGITAVPSGFTRSLLPGGPPDRHGMSEPMTRIVAVPGATKYSARRTVGTARVASGNEKISASGGQICAPSREQSWPPRLHRPSEAARLPRPRHSPLAPRPLPRDRQ
jgi:hypothetical protein